MIRALGGWLFLTVLLCGSAAAAGLFERKVEVVEEGNRAFAEQHYQQALESYERAEQQLVQQPRIHFDRGGALFKLGRHQEAREAYLRAMGEEDPEIKKRNLFNIGNTFLAEGALEDAAAYFRRALEMDPGFDDARYNLELVLRAMEEQKKNPSNQKKNEPPKKQPPQDQQKKEQQQQQQQEQQQKQQEDQQDQQQPQQQQQSQQDQQNQQEQQQNEQQGQQQQPDKAQAEQQQSKEQQEPSGADGQRPQPSPQKMSRQQIQALLQAMKEGEKPFQMHRFVIPEFRRKQIDKDW